MDKNKGTIHWKKIWDEKPDWAAEIINEVEGTNYTAESLKTLKIPCAIISAIINLYGLKFNVDWSGYNQENNKVD